jgi:uncharacterized protein (DUF427 family)
MADDEREREIWRNVARERPSRIARPGPGQESVWDYPRPPRVEPVAKRIRVEYAGVVIADTERAQRVLETAGPPVYYLPPDDVRVDLLTPGSNTTLCEWKGRARYWSLRVGVHGAEDAAWSYPDPDPAYAVIRDALAFHAGRVDACYVAGQRVTPQPGEYYGGWITSDISGPFKGIPGSERW